MRFLRLLVWMLPAVAGAQNLQVVLKQGADVFGKTCSAGYCHGNNGAGGGAPRLSGRGFDQAFLTATVTRGIQGTAMPAFGASLPRPELIAVVAYVATLNGIANPRLGANADEAFEPARPALSAEAARGHDLFFDAVRGFARCSTCHEQDGVGIPIATPIVNVPADAAALRALATPAVATAVMGGESMPALVVGKTTHGLLFYDLTTPPPVLHTVAPGAADTKPGNAWKHSSVIGSYNDSDLAAILVYLRAVVKP